MTVSQQRESTCGLLQRESTVTAVDDMDDFEIGRSSEEHTGNSSGGTKTGLGEINLPGI